MASSSLPPTSFLPPLRREPTEGALVAALAQLESIYASHNGQESDDGHEWIYDQTERSYVISWLERLIASELGWLSEEGASDVAASSSSSSAHSAATDLTPEALIDRSAALIQTVLRRTGEEAESAHLGVELEKDEPLQRSFTFPFDFERLAARHKRADTNGKEEGKRPTISIILTDAPLPPSEDAKLDERPSSEKSGDHVIPASLEASTAVGVQTWAAAIVLSDLLVRSPHEVHSRLSEEDSTIHDHPTFRVAELGAGTGLVGLVCAHYLHQQSSGSTPAEVVLTDYHPRVLANLQSNVDANPLPSASCIDLKVNSLDWSHYAWPTSFARPSPEDPATTYSLLLAADVVYSPTHAQWLYATMSSLLSREDPAARAHVLNARREHGRFGEWDLIGGTDAVFGPVWQGSEKEESAGQQEGERRLRVIRREELPKRKGLGREDERGHVWWTLAWR